MAELRSAYTKEEIKEATRLLLQIRNDCVKIDTDVLLRKEKYNALNMAIDGLQYLPEIEDEDKTFHTEQERGSKMKIYATEMRNGKILDKKLIGEARLLKDGNGSACIISARKYNELKRKSFSAFKKAHKGGYSIILMTEDNRKCSFGGYPLEFGYVRFD